MSDTVRDAATVILLRDGDAGIETYLLRRATTMAFAPRMHVYPGGRVDEQDHAADIALTVDQGELERLAARASTDVPGLLALYNCAVREVAEETGVVLASARLGATLRIDPSVLPIMDHWVTPEVEKKRYDVRFFVARVPNDQTVALTTTEADGAFWVSPQDALAQFAAGELAMLPPTQATLQYLTGFATIDDALAAASAREVVPLLPRRLVGDDGVAHWALVNDRTGSVVVTDVEAPHTRETDGLAFPEHLR